MKPVFTLAAVGMAASLPFVEIGQYFADRQHTTYYGDSGYSIAAVQADHRRFTDVGSHGPGFEFMQQGPIRVIAPAL